MLNIMVFVDIYIYIFIPVVPGLHIAWGKKTHVPVVKIIMRSQPSQSSMSKQIATSNSHSTRWYQTEFHQNLHSFPQKSPPKSPRNHPENHREPASQEIKGGGRQAFRAEVWALQQLQDEGWDGMGIDVKQNMRNTWAVLKSHHLSVIPPVIW